VDALSALEVDTDRDAEDPSILNRAVCGILREQGCTVSDFRALDEKPGAAPLGGYRFSTPEDLAAGRPNREWHWKLRRVRNRCAALFDNLSNG